MAIAAFLIALLTGMGVGSGGLFVVYLTMLVGIDQLAAQGLNLYFFIFSTAAALLLHSRKIALPLKTLALICAVGSVGCVFGAILAQNIDSTLLRRLFAYLLIASGGITILQGKKKNKKIPKSLYK